MRYVYQVNENKIYSSRLKAHRKLCESLGKDGDKFLPHKEIRDKNKNCHTIVYPNGHTIVKSPLL